jgi:hypothetical protein
MNVVTRSALRITIYNIILETITVSPESERNEFNDECYPTVTKTAIISFIESNPYFDEMLKTFLKDKFIEDVDAIIVSEEWKTEFVKRVYKCAKSFQMDVW